MADTAWHIEELLVRGRPAGSDLPVTYQVMVQERITLADGRSSILQEKTLTPEQAAEAGFDLATINAWVDTELSADLTQTRAMLSAMTQERDAWMEELANCKRERDALALILEDAKMKIAEDRAEARAERRAAADAAMAAAAVDVPADEAPAP